MFSLSVLLIFSLSNCSKGNSDNNSNTNTNNSSGNSQSSGNWKQQGTKLVGTGAVGAAFQGNDIGLSSDGNTVFFAGWGDMPIGSAWAFSRTNGTWTQEGGKLVGSGVIGGITTDLSVSISGDGNTAVVGDPNATVVLGNPSYYSKGVIWVYTRTGGTWVEQTKLGIRSGTSDDYVGSSVAISADGNTMIVCGGGWSNAPGGAWVFVRSNGSWVQQGGKLVGSGASIAAFQGTCVAVSADGNTFVMGGWNDYTMGAAWVFTRSNGTWTQQGSKLVGSDATTDAQQGTSVSISGDGNTVVVGGPNDNAGIGAAWVYTSSGGVWTQQGNKLIGSGASGKAGQGRSVALSGDGNTLVVGGYKDNTNAGAVWIYSRSNGTWTQTGDKLVPTGAVGGAAVGTSVAINSNGTTLAVGGSSDDGQKGAVWIFTR